VTPTRKGGNLKPASWNYWPLLTANIDLYSFELTVIDIVINALKRVKFFGWELVSKLGGKLITREIIAHRPPAQRLRLPEGIGTRAHAPVQCTVYLPQRRILSGGQVLALRLSARARRENSKERREVCSSDPEAKRRA
jgi:hypothetical protein